MIRWTYSSHAEYSARLVESATRRRTEISMATLQSFSGSSKFIWKNLILPPGTSSLELTKNRSRLENHLQAATYFWPTDDGSQRLFATLLRNFMSPCGRRESSRCTLDPRSTIFPQDPRIVHRMEISRTYSVWSRSKLYHGYSTSGSLC